MPAASAQRLAERMGRGLAFGREAERQDYLLHGGIGRTFKQFGHPNVAHAHTVERRQPAHQYEVQAAVAAGALKRGLIGRCLDDAQLARITCSVAAHRAHRRLAEGVTTLTVLHLGYGAEQCLRQLPRSVTVVLQKVKSHALRRLDAHARQTTQRVDQRIE